MAWQTMYVLPLLGALFGCALGTVTLKDYPTIIDADTVILSNEKIRFRSIDAPETGQQCQDGNGNDYFCGVVATEALRHMIGDAEIRCVGEGRDKYGRLLGECYLGEVNVSQWLVFNGYALAYRKHSTRYAEEEDQAQTAKRGIWAGTFTPPWEWRREH